MKIKDKIQSIIDNKAPVLFSLADAIMAHSVKGEAAEEIEAYVKPLLKAAFEAGQRQTNDAWIYEQSTAINPRVGNKDMTFESWLNDIER